MFGTDKISKPNFPSALQQIPVRDTMLTEPRKTKLEHKQQVLLVVIYRVKIIPTSSIVSRKNESSTSARKSPENLLKHLSLNILRMDRKNSRVELSKVCWSVRIWADHVNERTNRIYDNSHINLFGNSSLDIVHATLQHVLCVSVHALRFCVHYASRYVFYFISRAPPCLPYRMWKICFWFVWQIFANET